MDYNNGVRIAPPSKSHALQLHLFGQYQHSKKGGHSLWTHFLSYEPSPRLLSSDLVLAGQNAHTIRRQYLRLFDNVESGNMHPLGFVA